MNKIRIEAILYAHGYSQKFGFCERLIRSLHDALSHHVKEANNAIDQDRFVNLAKSVWRRSRQRGHELHMSRETAKTKRFTGRNDEWSNTDYVLAFNRDDVIIGLEYGMQDKSNNATASEIESLIQDLLANSISPWMSMLKEHSNHKASAIPGIAIAVECDGLDGGSRAWAQQELAQLYERSLSPTKQENKSDAKLDFAKHIRSPNATQGLSLAWNFSTPQEYVQTWAHGGPRVLSFFDGTSFEVFQIFWLKQGGEQGALLPSGRPYVPNHRAEVFRCSLLAARAEALRSEMHAKLERNERGLQRFKRNSLEQVEYTLAKSRQLNANLKRYRINSRTALLSLGCLESNESANGLLDYFGEIEKQLEVEIQRFEPAATRVATALERSGGILGWPGFVLACAALVLATLDTWWGVIGSVSTQDTIGENLPFAKTTVLSISVCLVASSIVLIALSIREFRKKRRTLVTTGVKFIRSFVYAFFQFRLWMLLIPGVLAMLIGIESLLVGAKALGTSPSEILNDSLEQLRLLITKPAE